MNTTVDAVVLIKEKIDATLERIKTERDLLREYVDEIKSIIDDAEEAHEHLTDARRALDNAADALSKYM